jgi:NAD-dependent SIR2 family protein deacetylase
MTPSQIAQAAHWINQANALIITAGAGMGVDSGLPDFRGEDGFWKAYPALGRARTRFSDIACPAAFRAHPSIAWGFYGHRLQMYRQVRPHAGFEWLHQWGQAKPRGMAVFTSNVDGHFQAAGFGGAPVLECHGSIHHLQCLAPCGEHIWSADGFMPEVDEDSGLLLNPPPLCPRCGGLARPNILMFGDAHWAEGRCQQQRHALRQWLSTDIQPIIIEIGAGTAISTVRHFSEQLTLNTPGARLVRINVREPEWPQALEGRAVALGLPALEALGEVGRAMGFRASN